MTNFSTFFSDNSLTIPLTQVIFYMFACAFCFLFRKYRLGLLVSYSFVFYWGLTFGQDYFITQQGKNLIELYVYLGCGLITAILALFSFFTTAD